LKITRPTLFTHIGKHEDCQEMARHLFSKVISGDVKIVIGQEFALDDVIEAHDALEARLTTGSTILTV
jgi:NADPH2:quinone reductase